MITREEAIDRIKSLKTPMSLGELGIHFAYLVKDIFDERDILEQHIKDLQAQLSNTEQLKCDGCKWYHKNTHDGCQSPYYNCVRNTHLQDRYQPKDTQ